MKDTIVEIDDYSNPTPLILVEGFLSSTGPVGWSPLRSYLCGYEEFLGDRDVMIASVGPISSLHDRACELYFAIKGGTVEYGEDHSQTHGHKRFGRDRGPGLYPSWSVSRPLHFLGHSIGGATIIKLQYLLSINFFSSDDHPDMILSVTGVSSPFRGTQVVYTLGERSDSAPAVRPFSIGNAISKAVHILSYFSPILPSALDLHAESRALSYHESTFFEFVRHLWKSDWAESRDATPFDVTFEAADLRDADGEGRCNPGTYYRSYTSYFTTRSSSSPNDSRHRPTNSHLLFPPLYLMARAIGSFDFSALIPRPSFTINNLISSNLDSDSDSPLTDPTGKEDDDYISFSPTTSDLREEHFANDGIVPVFSQWHPLDCTQTHCTHHPPPSSSQSSSSSLSSTTFPKDPSPRPHPGHWDVHTLKDHHHLSLLPIYIESPSQVKFWSDLGFYLDSIDSQEREGQSYV